MNMQDRETEGRQLLLDRITDTLKRVHDTPFGDVDYFQESTDLLEMIEARCTGGLHGELIFGDIEEDDALMEGA